MAQSFPVPSDHVARRATLGDQLRRNALRIGDQEAIVAVGHGSRRALTFADLDLAATRLGSALRAHGVGRGDVVALIGRSTPELLVGFWGAVKAGAAATGVNPAFTPRELHHQLAHSRAKVIVATAEAAALIDDLEAPLPDLRLRVTESGDAPAGWQALASLVAGADDAAPAADIHEDDPALIPYTSGTTALPKAVMLSHRTYVAATIPAYAAGLGFREGDRFYYVMPLHTMAGLGSQVSLLSVGATVVLPSEVTPDAALRVLVDERITIMGQTPTFYLQLLRAAGFDAADLSALERCVTYGGTMPRAMFEGFAAAAPGLVWLTLWSQSEIGQTPTVGRFRSLDDIPGGDPAWIGRPTPQLEVRVVDADGADADEGELLCRTPGVMLGYLDDPDRTAEVLKDGWLHTGDLVRRDAAGDLFFVDRRHDVIKSGGMNVSSVEVERVLYGHGGVLEAAVVGLPDDYWGQAVTAYVVARDGAQLDAGEVIAHARTQLAAFKLPKTVRIVDALPKDAQGKILKREIRAREQAGTG
ncbi:Long-chain-fatty-acid--CoA ligase [Paraconexibacter sp. AEG42_29]|uniref:Long-chain-fatty-acid--CoA ligase n=1 Tax=Paraconexibacter sp. AEG42_29 TaxID=2997339 RepID=A0AAU7AXL2_9ACTN